MQNGSIGKALKGARSERTTCLVSRKARAGGGGAAPRFGTRRLREASAAAAQLCSAASWCSLEGWLPRIHADQIDFSGAGGWEGDRRHAADVGDAAGVMRGASPR